MSTIYSMTQSTYSMYKYAQKNGASLFGSTSASSSSSSAWNPYSSTSSASSSVLSGLNGIRTSTQGLLSDYATASKTFYTDFDSTMKDLKGSAQAVSKLDFSSIASEKDALTTAENADGTTSTKMSKSLTDAVGAVKQLVSDYNDAIDFFSDNSDVSKRVGRMQDMFADTSYRSGSYSSIGITVGDGGKLSVDEDRLAKAITESPEKVSGILGKYGLSGKAEDHVSVANGQRDQLFPSVDTMLGSQLKSSSVYTGSSLLSLSKYASMGNFLNMFA